MPLIKLVSLQSNMSVQHYRLAICADTAVHVIIIQTRTPLIM